MLVLLKKGAEGAEVPPPAGGTETVTTVQCKWCGGYGWVWLDWTYKVRMKCPRCEGKRTYQVTDTGKIVTRE